MPNFFILPRPLMVLLMPILGPTLFVPLWAWRTVHKFVRSPALRLLAMAPGVYALVALLAVTVLRLYNSEGSLQRAAELSAYSPLNAAAHDLSRLVDQMGILPPLEAAFSAVTTWAILAAICTVFLSPLYARLAASSANVLEA